MQRLLVAFARSQQAEADAAQARALQEQSLAAESEARQKAWAAQQEALLKTRAAEAKANAEALAYARAYSYQEEQIEEIRHQMQSLSNTESRSWWVMWGTAPEELCVKDFVDDRSQYVDWG